MSITIVLLGRGEQVNGLSGKDTCVDWLVPNRKRNSRNLTAFPSVKAFVFFSSLTWLFFFFPQYLKKNYYPWEVCCSFIFDWNSPMPQKFLKVRIEEQIDYIITEALFLYKMCKIMDSWRTNRDRLLTELKSQESSSRSLSENYTSKWHTGDKTYN